MQGNDNGDKGGEDLKEHKEQGQVAKLKAELREAKMNIIVLEAQVTKLEAQLTSAKVLHIPPHISTCPCMIILAFLVCSAMCCSCLSFLCLHVMSHVCARACTQEVAILEYQNKQKDESASLSEQVQAAYDKGYDKAVETITRFQNLRPAGAPPSAMSSQSFSG